MTFITQHGINHAILITRYWSRDINHAILITWYCHWSRTAKSTNTHHMTLHWACDIYTTWHLHHVTHAELPHFCPQFPPHHPASYCDRTGGEREGTDQAEYFSSLQMVVWGRTKRKTPRKSSLMFKPKRRDVCYIKKANRYKIYSSGTQIWHLRDCVLKETE